MMREKVSRLNRQARCKRSFGYIEVEIDAIGQMTCPAGNWRHGMLRYQAEVVDLAYQPTQTLALYRPST